MRDIPLIPPNEFKTCPPIKNTKNHNSISPQMTLFLSQFSRGTLVRYSQKTYLYHHCKKLVLSNKVLHLSPFHIFRLNCFKLNFILQARHVSNPLIFSFLGIDISAVDGAAVHVDWTRWNISTEDHDSTESDPSEMLQHVWAATEYPPYLPHFKSCTSGT